MTCSIEYLVLVIIVVAAVQKQIERAQLVKPYEPTVTTTTIIILTSASITAVYTRTTVVILNGTQVSSQRK